MRRTPYIHRLVKSLSPTEKRQFKRNNAAQLEKVYLKLFEAIDQQEQYNEEELLQKFKDETFVKQFSVAKNYLVKCILKSLRSSGQHMDSSAHITEDLSNAKILYDRGFYDQALRLIRRTREIAQRFDKLDELVTILRWESILISNALSGHRFYEQLKENRLLYEDTLERLNYKNQVTKLTNEAYHLYVNVSIARSDSDLEKLAHILNHPLLQEDNLEKWEGAKRYLYSIRTWYYSVKYDYEKIMRLQMEEQARLEKDEVWLADNLEYYKEVLTNIAASSIQTRNYDRFYQILNKLKSVKKKFTKALSPRDRSHLVLGINRLELNCLLQQGKYRAAIKVCNRIEKDLQNPVLMLQGIIYEEIIYSCMLIYFYGGEHRAALNWYDRLLKNEKFTAVVDIQCYARVIHVLIHYELGNRQFLYNEVNSVRRYLKRKGRLFGLEALILKYIGMLNKTIDKGEEGRLLLKLRTEVDQLANKGYEGAGTKYLDIQRWIELRLNQRLHPTD